MRIGASASMRRRRFQSTVACNAFAKSPASSASRRVLPANAGSSQASSVASNAASDRSGKPSSGAHARRQRTRARHCCSDFAPRQRVEPEFAHGIGQCARGLRRIDAARRACIEHDAVEARSRCATSARRVGVPAHGVFARRNVPGSRGATRASSTGAPRSSKASFASKRSSLATSQGSPNSALSSNKRRHAAVRELVATRIASACWRAMRSGKACASRSPSAMRVDARAAALRRPSGADAIASPPHRWRRSAPRLPPGVVPAAECGERAPAFGEGIAARAQADRALRATPRDRRRAHVRWRRAAQATSRPGADACRARACGGRAA